MNHHPKCECDFCFAALCERVADAMQAQRLATSPLATLPGWHRAERIAREMGEGRMSEAAE